MKPIAVERVDVNSESALLREWLVADGDEVVAGRDVCVVETSKAVFEVEAPANGILVHVLPAGTDVPFNVPVGYVAGGGADVARARQLSRQVAGAAARGGLTEVRATRKARQLAGQYGIDLAGINKPGLITEKDVRATLAPRGGEPEPAPEVITESAVLPRGVPRVLVIGAGLGAMQVIDILLNDPRAEVVGCLDDDVATHDRRLFGVPVWGATAMLERAWRDGRFDRAVISISTSIAARKNLFEQCKKLGIPLVNAVDPTVRMNRGVLLGEGNVLCSHVHLGVATVLGDNNFVSANTSIDHHNVWGSHNTTGPNCATSSRVLVEDEVVFGTGVFVEPGIGIGSRVRIASGAVLTRSVPEDHAVKTHVTTRVMPLPGQTRKESQ